MQKETITRQELEALIEAMQETAEIKYAAQGKSADREALAKEKAAIRRQMQRRYKLADPKNEPITGEEAAAKAAEAWNDYKAEADKSAKKRKKAIALNYAKIAIEQGKADLLPGRLEARAKARTGNRKAQDKKAPCFYRITEEDKAGRLLAVKDHKSSATAQRGIDYRKQARPENFYTLQKMSEEQPQAAAAEALSLRRQTQASKAEIKGHKKKAAALMKEAAEAWKLYRQNGGQHQPTAAIIDEIKRSATNENEQQPKQNNDIP